MAWGVDGGDNGGATLVVSTVHTHSCFVGIPVHWAEALWDELAANQQEGAGGGVVVLEISWEGLPQPTPDRTSAAHKPAGSGVLAAATSSSTASAKALVRRRAYVGWSGDCSALAAPPTAPSSSSASPWAFGPTQTNKQPPGCIELDAAFAQALNLQTGTPVHIAIVTNTPRATSITVDPLTSDDWEILSLHASYLETQLLRQLRVVYLGQVVTVWVHHRTCVRLVVTDVAPKGQTCVRLAEDVEIAVAPKPRQTAQHVAVKGDGGKSTSMTPITSIARFMPPDLSRMSEAQSVPTEWTVLASPSIFTSPIHPSNTNTAITASSANTNFNDVIVYLEHLDMDCLINRNHTDTDTQQKQLSQHSESDSATREPSSTSLPIAFARLRVSNHVMPGHVVCGRTLQQVLDVQPFARVKITVVGDAATPGVDTGNKPDVTNTEVPHMAIVVNNRDDLPKDPCETLYQWISSRIDDPLHAFVIFDGMPVPLSLDEFTRVDAPENRNTKIAKLVFTNNQDEKDEKKEVVRKMPRHRVVRGVDLAKLKGRITARVDTSVSSSSSSSSAGMPRYGTPRSPTDRLMTSPGFEHVIVEAVEYVSKCAILRNMFQSLGTPRPGALLIYGPSGSGKTTISRAIAFRLERDQLLHHTVIQCNQLAKLTPSKVRDVIEDALDRAAWHAPAMIVLEDLDAIVPVESEQGDGLRSRALAHAIMSAVARVTQSSGGIDVMPEVYVMATAKDKTAIHASLIERHFFGCMIPVPMLDKQQRVDVLSHLVAVSGLRCHPLLDLDVVAAKMDGYVVSDVKQVVDRANQRRAMRLARHRTNDTTDSSIDGHDDLIPQDVDAAIEGYRPSSLRDIKLHTSTVVWSDIGGMHSVKRVLLETVQWPAMYPQIFAQSPIRLRTGILLFGYPGCGKTMIASSVASQCGMNFVSIKGPELLNKYIGASEKSVRDLFTKAQSAKPCCLFFDEFESIAPRRGHDSTGVTDRVVNQLLTQMDGAEGLDGVVVIAATSRPDLIDPALVRPGRLDRSVFCDLPSRDDRCDILCTLAQRLNIDCYDEWVDGVADRTGGFSGADLQGLMTTAQLSAIRESLHDSLDLTHSSDDGRDRRQSLVSSSTDTDDGDFPFVVVAGNDRVENTQSLKTYLSKLELRLNAPAQTDDAAGADTNQMIRNSTRAPIVVQTHHVMDALAGTRASVSADDRRRLAGVYAKFMSRGGSEVNVGTRASLA